ncbi:glycosyl transferase, WecB/TagA/CpsF family [Stanieria sp. NIES-3757]|nr:glycosyl transferase, WecB/TagA/CpsF family [Stanieria sp. NIES-3757]
MDLTTTNKTHEFEEVHLFGTRFHKLTVCQLIEYIVKAAKFNQKTIVGHVNIRGMNFAWEKSWYKNFYNQADLVFCDGFGVLLGAKLHGNCVDKKHRMTCPDYIENLAKTCERNNVSLFLLAGKPGVTDQAIAKLTKVAPQLRIAGHHGYFAKSGWENEVIIEQINQFKPDVLYIGFGMPLQERWILENIAKINAKVFLPLGACLDFYTETVYRGPQWMTDAGLEWLSRLLTEPKRLWKRYIIGNSLFAYRVLLEYLSQRINRSSN